jgi:hypothetical protein
MSRQAPSVLPVLHRGDLSPRTVAGSPSRGCRPLSLTRKESGIREMPDASRRLTRNRRELG